jgi:hypothetical protein
MKLLKIKKIFDYRRFEDTKRVIRRRKSEKYRQYLDDPTSYTSK